MNLSDNDKDLEDEDDWNHEVLEDTPQDRRELDPEDESLLAINVDQHRSRSAVSATFRGYCSEAFVYGKCARQLSGCTFDHSTAGQERCIQSFSLLTKHELQLHGQLEPRGYKRRGGALRPLGPIKFSPKSLTQNFEK